MLITVSQSVNTFFSEANRIEFLFDLYAKYTEPLLDMK